MHPYDECTIDVDLHALTDR